MSTKISTRRKRSSSTHNKSYSLNKFGFIDHTSEIKKILNLSSKPIVLKQRKERNGTNNNDAFNNSEINPNNEKQTKIISNLQLSNKKLTKSVSVGKLPLIQSQNKPILKIQIKPKEEDKDKSLFRLTKGKLFNKEENNQFYKLSINKDKQPNQMRSKSKKRLSVVNENIKMSSACNPIIIRDQIQNENENIKKEEKVKTLEDNIKRIEIKERNSNLPKEDSPLIKSANNLSINNISPIKLSQDVTAETNSIKLSPFNEDKNIDDILKEKEGENKTSQMIELLKKNGTKLRVKSIQDENKKDKIEEENKKDKEEEENKNQSPQIKPISNISKKYFENDSPDNKIKKGHKRHNSDLAEGIKSKDKAIKIFQSAEEKIDSSVELIKSYEYLSQAGKNEQGKIKTNQDSYLINFKINGKKNYHMFGVLDGHGLNGHFASSLATNFLKNYFTNSAELKEAGSLENIYNKLKENDYDLIKTSFKKAEKHLSSNKTDFSFSGTTCVICFFIGKKIICANVGDSRAIMVSQNINTGNYSVKALSRDHKPNIPSEKKRIESKGGLVEPYKDDDDGSDVGPHRVWVRNKDGLSEGYPGLAMSRSIGDLIGSSVGVIPEAEIKEFEINDESKFIIIASDGVWEFMENEKVMNVAKKYYETNDNAKLCKTLVKQSTKLWEKEDAVIDDITCVSIFF
ncbi:MAG: protein phosphatase 2C domain-containing protein [archaeon]|nr:protein phosphatase 2C domain-containing protein [archaeon]